MTKGHVVHLLHGHLAKTLSPREAERVKTHLIFCLPCRRQSQALEKDLGSQPEGAAAVHRRQSRMEKQLQAPDKLPVRGASRRAGIQRTLRPAALLLLLLVVVGGLAVWHWPFQESPVVAPPAPPTVAPAETDFYVAAPPQKQPIKTVASVPNPQPTPITEWKGDTSGVKEPLQIVFTKQSNWVQHWETHSAGRTPGSSAPAVDFAKNDVIAIFLGQKPSPGYGVEIVSVGVSDWEGMPARLVRYRTWKPRAGMVAAAVLTHPYVMRVVPKKTGPTFFRQVS